MKKLYLILAWLLCPFILRSQTLDGYKYVVIGNPIYQDGSVDYYGLASTLRANFAEIGFTVLSEKSEEWPEEAQLNPCLVMSCEIDNKRKAQVKFSLKNCKRELILEEKGTSVNWVGDVADNYQRAISKCWNRIKNLSYHFSSSQTPQKDYPKLEIVDRSEASIKEYLSSALVDKVEGIYKTYLSDQPATYKLAIIKERMGSGYKAIVLESNLPQWKEGEVKATFEATSAEGVYSVVWYLGNKTHQETFGSISNGTLLEVQLKNLKSGEARIEKFIKIYPQNIETSKTQNQFVRSSGSGFFISNNGMIATNAHVVNGAKSIEVNFTNGTGNHSYKAEVLIKDVKNDIAILQIKDEDFKVLSASIPYKLLSRSLAGSKVFTIGFPLNSVMGTNYKVTDGIISSSSGIADDERYYQISVPLQPGNSGGALFDTEGNIVGITSAKLDSKAVGTEIENVNYAVKIGYLLALSEMLPNPPKFPNSSSLSGKSLKDQVIVLKNFVCRITATMN